MRTSIVSIAVLMLISPAAFAHAGHGETGFMEGASHPIHGLDHLLAMVSVGLLAVRCASRASGTTDSAGTRHALWQIPGAFMVAMAVGGCIAWAGIPLPLAEWGIALSVLVFGVLVALGNAPRTWVACLVVALFALLHGHAHVAEMDGANVAVYMGGFLATTAVLHSVSIGSGLMLSSALKQTSIRAVGSSVAAASAALFYGLAAS